MSVYNTLCFLSFAAMVIALINSKLAVFANHHCHHCRCDDAFFTYFNCRPIVAGSTWLILPPKPWQKLTLKASYLTAFSGFLLFAGGLGIKLPHFADQKWEITILALGGTLFSTFFIRFSKPVCYM